MNLGDKILKLLAEPRFRYKGASVNIFGLPAFSSYKKQTLYNSLSELKKGGYVSVGEDKARISALGRKYIERKIDSLPRFDSSFEENSPKNLIFMYDIPLGRKAEREWLRSHLVKFGYEMIQKSVWVGPSPLPPEFVVYLKQAKLHNGIKILKLAKEYKQGSFSL